LEEPFLAGFGQLGQMLLHASLDPALPGRDLTAEARDIGLACLKDRPSAGPHLRHCLRAKEQQDGANRYGLVLEHGLSSIAVEGKLP
jgi:hypothetical protein